MKHECPDKSVLANDKEVDIMPTIELMEYEKTAYIKGMEAYLQKLRLMPNNEAVKKSQESLENCHILREDGEFSERYSNTRKYVQYKE